MFEVVTQMRSRFHTHRGRVDRLIRFQVRIGLVLAFQSRRSCSRHPAAAVGPLRHCCRFLFPI